MKRKTMREREINKTQKKQKKWCNCSPPTDRCPGSSRAAIAAPQPTPPSLYTEHDVIWYGIALWPVSVICPGYAPSQLLVHLLTGRLWEAEKSLTYYKHCLATTKTSVCYHIILMLNPTHSTIPATRKKINSIPDETRTSAKKHAFFLKAYGQQLGIF